MDKESWESEMWSHKTKYFNNANNYKEIEVHEIVIDGM